jgi:hypothetical protein
MPWYGIFLIGFAAGFAGGWAFYKHKLYLVNEALALKIAALADANKLRNKLP